MDTKEKAFKAFNHGTGKIDLSSRHTYFLEMKPTEIHLKTDATLKDEPGFTIVMERPDNMPVVGQISLEMLNEGLEELGYKITKI